MKNFIYRQRYWIGSFIILILLGGSGVWYFNQSSESHNSYTKKESIWQTTSPQKASDFSAIKVVGKVKSNGFAVISPRRSGIIQDLLVDIGDKVTKGQTIGSMLPEGVEGQSSAAIAEASAKLQKARAELSQAQGVATDSVSVATKQWRESNLQSETQASLDQETQKQLIEKKSEAVLVATQAWENTKLILFGAGASRGSRDILGGFADAIQENNVENLADEIQRMEESGQWNSPEKIIEHLVHLESFLTQVETLYRTAREGRGVTATQINNNINIIQTQQLKVSQIKQAIFALEEKSKRFTSLQAEREAGADRSREVLDLVQSQQDLSITKAEKNIEVALANYNAALVKAGHQSITSPFDGVITARMVEVGQAVTMNMPLFYLEGVQTARSQESLSEIHFSLPESWRGKVSVGDMVTIKSLGGQSFKGRIFRLSEQIDLNTNSIMATATAFETTYKRIEPEGEESEDGADDQSQAEKQEVITPLNFPHGQSMFVYLEDSASQIFSVPTLSLKKRGNEYFIWKLLGEEPQQVPVEIIAEDGESTQIFTNEITLEDLIISNPSVSLFKKKK